MTLLPDPAFQKILEYCDDRKERHQRLLHRDISAVISIFRLLADGSGLSFKRVAFIYGTALEENGGRLFPSEDGRRMIYLPP